MIATLVLAVATGTSVLTADDWPQILGPSRNGIVADETLPDRLPLAIQPAWTVSTGSGYAGPAVIDGQVILFDRQDDRERLRCVAQNNGKPRWKQEYEAHYRGGVDTDTGPRCVPVVTHDTVIAYGAAGVLYAVALSDGAQRWRRDLLDDYGGTDGYFGAGSTPIVMDDRVLVNVGGRNGAGIVALDVKTGKTLWKATNEAASYASPVSVVQAGKRRTLFVTRLNALLIDPYNGTVAARRKFGQTGPTVNAATPISFDNYVFLTASYRVGAALLQVNNQGWETLWANDETLSSQYNTPVYADGHLYGIHGREDVGRAELRCVEATTGRVMWKESDFGVAHLIRVGDRFLILKVDGTLVMAEVSSQAFRLLGKARVSRRTTRALPALSNGQLLIRESAPQGGRLLCLPL